MALSFPRNLPGGVPIYCTAFDLDVVGDLSATNAGDPLIVQNGPSIWKASFTTPELRGANFRAMEAWLLSVKSPPQPFWSPDLRAKYPRAYQGGFGSLTRAGGGAFDGTCTVSSVGGDGVTLGLSTLPVGFGLGPGDPLCFDYDNGGFTRRAYHRVVSGAAVANGSGVISVEVRPVLTASLSNGTAVTLLQPKAKFLLVPGSDKCPRSDIGRGVFSFDARQTLK